MWYIALFILVSCFTYVITTDKSGCTLSKYKEDPKMDIFWVNLESSTERKTFMMKQFSFYGLDSSGRTNAITPDRVFIPEELSSPIECVSLANQSIPNLSQLNESTNNTSSTSTNIQTILLTHCGRKKNKRKEIVVTISHLNTIRKAIYEGNSSHPYALMLEDDLQFALEIDFASLISTAPSDFGVLQLVTSNDYAVLELWRVYQR